MSDNNTEWQYTEQVKGSKRTVRTHGMRISRAKLLQSLTPTLLDCQREIAIAFDLISLGWGYALLGVKCAPMYRTGGGAPSQEFIDAVRKKIGKLHGWEFATNKDWVNAVTAIERDGMTAREYAERLGVAPNTVLSWYKRGLNEYGVRNGMENQI